LSSFSNANQYAKQLFIEHDAKIDGNLGISEDILFGTTGEISNERLHLIKQKLGKWITGNTQ
jgi:hypothetical protein